MITLTLHCGQCSKEKTVNLADTLPQTTVLLITRAASEGRSKWHVQENGGYIDTYCSVKCAI